MPDRSAYTLRAYAAPPQTPPTRSPDQQLNEDIRLAGLKARTLKYLVLDDKLRDQIDATRSAVLKPSLMFNSDPKQADQLMTDAMKLFNEVQSAVAAPIRTLYEDWRRQALMSSAAVLARPFSSCSWPVSNAVVTPPQCCTG